MTAKERAVAGIETAWGKKDQEWGDDELVAGVTEAIEAAILEEREKQIREHNTSGLGASADELLERLAWGMVGGRELVSMKPLVQATFNVVAAKEREAICQLIDDNDHMGTTELIETIRKRG